MYLLAIKMLLGDRVKFHALIFAIACSAFLISQQVSIFTGLMDRTTSQIRDVGQAAPRAELWVMDPSVRYVDEIRALDDGALGRVKSVPEVESGVRLFKGFARASSREGTFRQAILMGFDDATLLGAPTWMLLGSAERLREPDAIIIDDTGFRSLFPGRELRLGDVLELNDRRGVIVGICRSRPPFATFPVIYARYQTALAFVGQERRMTSFILATPREGVSASEAGAAIERGTGLKARSASAFAWETILFYVANTGIPVNFSITIITAVVIGLVVTAQTFLLFVVENIRNFAALKAIGAPGALIVRLVVAQALLVGVLGLGLGLGLSAAFFESTREIPKLRNFVLHGEIAVASAVLVLAIALLSSVLAARSAARVQPATVFR
jgi:putative ABC transport system permease protein